MGLSLNYSGNQVYKKYFNCNGTEISSINDWLKVAIKIIENEHFDKFTSKQLSSKLGKEVRIRKIPENKTHDIINALIGKKVIKKIGINGVNVHYVVL